MLIVYLRAQRKYNTKQVILMRIVIFRNTTLDPFKSKYHKLLLGVLRDELRCVTDVKVEEVLRKKNRS